MSVIFSLGFSETIFLVDIKNGKKTILYNDFNNLIINLINYLLVWINLIFNINKKFYYMYIYLFYFI